MKETDKPLELVTVRQLSILLNISEGGIRNLCSRKQIPYYKIKGLGVRFNLPEIKKFLLKDSNKM